MGPIRLDPATTSENPVGARRYITKSEFTDGLLQTWARLADEDPGSVFCNPPYSEIKAWTRKAIAEAEAGSEIVYLVAARPGTRWYRDLQRAAIGLCEVEGRLRFEGAPSSAPFPSAIFYFGSRFSLFYQAFSSIGHVSLNLGRLGLILTSSTTDIAREMLEADVSGIFGGNDDKRANAGKR